jgi:hypothetical protein
MRGLTFIAPMGQAVLARLDNRRGGPADHPRRKMIENRPKALPKKMATRPGAIVAVHCGLKWSDEYADTCRQIFGPKYDLIPGSIQHGQIIGLMKLTGRQFTTAPKALDTQFDYDPWYGGPFGYEIAEAVAFQNPIPCRGMQGWWPVPTDIAFKIGLEMSEVDPHWAHLDWSRADKPEEAHCVDWWDETGPCCRCGYAGAEETSCLS